MSPLDAELGQGWSTARTERKWGAEGERYVMSKSEMVRRHMLSQEAGSIMVATLRFSSSIVWFQGDKQHVLGVFPSYLRWVYPKRVLFIRM